MIRCPGCGTESPPGSRFCSGCGEPLVGSCVSCRQEVGTWMAFCPYCGTRLGGAPAVLLQSAPAAEEGSENSLRLATVLFGDVQGFTAMSEHLPPEEVTDIMNRCWHDLGECIVQYGGTIDKYVGDAIMARFGWPTAHEDDALR